MRARTVAHVFRKDGLELLRDRRTIFVNVVLPVLLYPVLALFALQVLQLTAPRPEDRPRIAAVDAPPALREVLADVAAGEREDETAPARAGPFHVADLDPAVADELRAAAGALPEDEEAARRELLDALRRHDLAAALIVGEADQDGRRTVTVAADDAHRRHDAVAAGVGRALERYERELVDERLARAGIARELIDPVVATSLGVAPPSEALRSRLAGIVPVLLVLMALSGAFYPALDLIAGERERGTLETLLSWPADRREVFLGKLLVVMAAAGASVALNLCSLALTVLVVGTQLPAEEQLLLDLGGGLSLGVGVLALSLLALLPLVVTLSAVSLAIAGIANSFKEAQNYLSPLFLAVLIPAVVTLVPGARPQWALDLVPVVGPLLALKESLQSPEPPWLHLLLATGASAALAAVAVAWSVRLLDQERFLYPGLVRAGWGRFRRWGAPPPAPGGLEALGLYAVATGLFLVAGPPFRQLGPVAGIAGPLIVCLLLPTLVHRWLGAYPARTAFAWRAPARGGWGVAVLLVPLLLVAALAIGELQGHVLGRPPPELERQMGLDLDALRRIGGLPLLIACAALLPALCEELLCRGTLLAGLTRSVGAVGGVAVSAFGFAALHGSPWRFLPQFALGLALGVLVLRSGSVWTAMLSHALFNAAVLVLATSLPALQPALSAPLAAALLALAALGCAVLLRARIDAPGEAISAGPDAARI